MKLSDSTRQPNQSFASVISAFSLFGSLLPHHANSTERRHLSFLQQRDDWNNGWYTPPRSPGFHEDFGS